MTSKSKNSKKRKATVKSPQAPRDKECVPYWTNITKDWSNQLLSCTKTDLKKLDKTLWNSSLKNLASNSWFQVTAHQYEQHEHLQSSIPLSPVIIEDVQEKIKKEEETKKERAVKRIKKEGKVTEDDKDIKQSNINKHTGRAKKVYEHPVRAIRMKIELTDNKDNKQKDKLNQWFGVCRFVYNKCVQWCRDKGYQLNRQDLRDKFKTIEFAKKYKWFYTKKFWDVYEKDGIDKALAIKGKYTVPLSVWDTAISDFDKAYRAHLAKRNKNKDQGKENDPSNKCCFKFRSKKDPQQSFEVQRDHFNGNHNQHSFLFHEDKFKVKSTHNMYNSDGTIDIQQKGKLPLVYNELKKRMTPMGSIRVIKERNNSNNVFLSIPRYIPVNNELTPEKDVVSMDPGVRTFMTTYDTNGFCSEWGEGDMKRVFALCLHLDKMIGRLHGSLMVNKHGKKARRKRKNLRQAIERLRSKIKNKINEVHKKMSTWLCKTYKVILIPKFNSKAMSKKANRKIHRKTVRGMLCWAHYRFRQRLINKSMLFKDCKVIECDEAYTSKTCGYCGTINYKLGSSKVFCCKHEDCTKKLVKSDRDIHAARNILLRYLSRNNIMFRQTT